jgi:uncharacterized repeat protein (TIGR04138 family)
MARLRKIMTAVNFEEALEKIVKNDFRYQREAYLFVREALDHTHKMIGKAKKGQVTGQELLAGIRSYALEEYGPTALALLHEWGLRRCEDFGEVVFNMVESNVLAKTEKDSREDFKNGYPFDQAFRQPYLPAGKMAAPEAEAKST